MEKILIFGHKNPDTDSIMSALIMEDLEKKMGSNVLACKLGNVNKETEYALKYFNVNEPITIDNLEEGQEVILVDHNEFAQSANGIEKAKILKVVDHHRICGFETSEPLFYIANPFGCTATILYDMYLINNFEISSTIAGLMLSAIISDTLLLKSPTTTPKDENAAKALAKIANVNLEKYGLAMLKAGTDLSSYTPEQLLTLDAKHIEIKNLKTIIAQVNTVDINDVMKIKSDIEKAMNNTINSEGLDLFILAITDIINNNSQIITLGNSSHIAEKAFNVKLEDNTAFLKGVVSRKKQILPVLIENA